eukprot:Skav209418  [mRNA]  locus=scaffold1411:236979:237573:+ [translate_table: standard]
MEIGGATLQDLPDDKQCLQVARALKHLHRHDVGHLDIKPSNLVYGRGERAPDSRASWGPPVCLAAGGWQLGGGSPGGLPQPRFRVLVAFGSLRKKGLPWGCGGETVQKKKWEYLTNHAKLLQRLQDA